jgi:flagellar hook protein FlgE
MISAMYNGISGLDSFQKALNVESHNISNVNTIGYKSDRINFADLMYQKGLGKGVATQSIQQDVSGRLITADGNYIQGVGATIQGDMIDNDIYTQFIASKSIENDLMVQTINSKATNYKQSAQNDIDELTGRITKTAGAKISDVELLISDYRNTLNAYANNQVEGVASSNQVSTTLFDDYATQLAGENDSVSIYIDNARYAQNFDTDAATTMQLLAEKISSLQGIKDATFDDATGNFVINTLVPGKNLTIGDAKINEQAYNSVNEDAIQGEGQAGVDSSLQALQEALQSANAQMTQITTQVDKSTLDNQALNMGNLGDLQLNLSNLGISDNQFSRPEISNGIIYMVQGDNKYAVGRIQTAAFADEHSLNPIGGNLFAATTQSGEPLDATSTSKILGGSLELSNANLSENLVNLMTYQRAYEANSKSITTSDEFLNIAIQLKK